MNTSTLIENQAPAQPTWLKEQVEPLAQELIERYGESQAARIRRGLQQVSLYWRDVDGGAGVFGDFVRVNFAGTQDSLDILFARFEALLEQLDGHLHEIGREFRQQLDLDRGPVLAFDEVFAGYDPGAHVLDDFFANKLAFVVLLNFPLTTLQERLIKGEGWTRRQWAEVRLAQRFSKRIPADVNQAISRAMAESSLYISAYNIWMHHLVDEKGTRLFPPGLRLLSHWNLRDEIKACYADAQNGIEKQRMIQKVMERIVTQTIPQVVIDNPAVDWNPFTNQVTAAAVRDYEDADVKQREKSISPDPEPATRYATLLKTFHAVRLADPYSPSAPTHIARRFEEDRELPEVRVQAMLEEVVQSPVVPRLATLIEKRLGRPLEPFDIWYNGFRASSQYSEAELDRIVGQHYTSAEIYKKEMPVLLLKLGFSEERARTIADRIAVDPARGSGHAMGAEMRGARSHLRTRIGQNGMNYKGFNVAAHEMGHNVEQTISIYDVDHTLLKGVPNTAFTEAFAFVFQGRDLELLGLAGPDEKTEASKVLNQFWGTYEIAGVALVDMAVWRWMYEHPDARTRELMSATLEIAKRTWNKFYAPVFRVRDVVLLGIYSHIIDSFLYIPDYPIGHLIAFQIEEQMRKVGSVGSEFERMAKMGRVAPDLWMKNATGRPVSAQALLHAAERALQEVDS
ncbi:MAG TPA: hypothetical protein VFA89_09470 [Terriglobales bacterium]|nr:hypothetical protein [Terriglobales bacterium]